MLESSQFIKEKKLNYNVLSILMNLAVWENTEVPEFQLSFIIAEIFVCTEFKGHLDCFFGFYSAPTQHCSYRKSISCKLSAKNKRHMNHRLVRM